MAAAIADEEREMAGRIAASWDEAVEQALAAVEPDDLRRAAEHLPRRRPRPRGTVTEAAGERQGPRHPGGPALDPGAPPRGDRRAPAEDRDPPRRARRRPVGDQGRRAAPRRPQLGRLLRRPARHPGQARRLRLRGREPRGRRLRAAAARRPARPRRGDRLPGRVDPRRGAERGAGRRRPVAGLDVRLNPSPSDSLLRNALDAARGGRQRSLRGGQVQVFDLLPLAVGALGEGVEVEAVEGLAEALLESVPELHLAADPRSEDLQLEDAAERRVAA